MQAERAAGFATLPLEQLGWEQMGLTCAMKHLGSSTYLSYQP